MKQFSEKLNILMKNKSLTHIDLARKMCVDPAIINRFCKGERNPNYENIIKISEALELSEEEVYFLILGKDYETTQEAIKKLYNKLPDEKKKIYNTIKESFKEPPQALEVIKKLAEHQDC